MLVFLLPTTGKNKEQFNKWCVDKGEFSLYNGKYLALENDDSFAIYFDEIPFEMQLGVFLAYYESLDRPISVDLFEDEMWYFKTCPYDYEDHGLDNQQEAYKEAFKKADELINDKL